MFHKRDTLLLFKTKYIIMAWGLTLLTALGWSDIFFLQSGQSLNGIALSEGSTEVEIQTVSARLTLPLSLISTWHREPNLQSYFRLSQEALSQEKFAPARHFLQKALSYDEQNAAIIAKLNDIDYAEINKTRVQPILGSIKPGNMESYLNAIKSLETLIKQHGKEGYIQKLNHDLANVRVRYALYLYNFVRNDEAFEQLRLARRIDESNENLHLALAKIQSAEGNDVLAKIEQDQANELAQQESEREEALNQMLASVQEPGCDDLPSPAYWAEQARLAELRKAKPSQTLFASIPVDKAISVLLQAYNAGPGAVVVYDGAVPYKETVNYVRTISSWINHTPESKQYDSLIRKYSRKYNLNSELVRALIKVESDFNPRAKSKKNARGLMQLTSTTWKDTISRMGVNWTFSKHAYDPEKNIEVGCHYLSWLKNEYLPKYFNMASLNSGNSISKVVY